VTTIAAIHPCGERRWQWADTPVPLMEQQQALHSTPYGRLRGRRGLSTHRAVTTRGSAGAQRVGSAAHEAGVALALARRRPPRASSIRIHTLLRHHGWLRRWWRGQLVRSERLGVYPKDGCAENRREMQEVSPQCASKLLGELGGRARGTEHGTCGLGDKLGSSHKP
jgi:hypothetical protein